MLDPLPLRSGASRALAAVLFLAALALGRILRTERAPREIRRRGALVITRRGALRRNRSDTMSGDAAPLRLGGVAIRAADETKHFKVLGTTGSGKTTAIIELLRGALARGDRAVIADPHGGYLERFYDAYRGDVILNPFDPRSVRWDPFGEVQSRYDHEELARSLIPPGDDVSGREWRGYARTFVAAVLRRSRRSGRDDLARLWDLLAVAPSAEVRRAVEGTAAAPLLDADNARMFGSVRSIAVSACAALEHIRDQRAAPFSVRGWVTGGRGVLFMPYRAGEIAALNSIIATWVRLAIFEALGGPQEGTRRLWFVVDELDALGPIDGLKDALARLRQFGGRCVLGFQSIAQVSSTYGSGSAQTLIENCSNTLILRCAGSEHGGTSQFASRLIGEREILRSETARGCDVGALPGARGARRSAQILERVVTEAAVLPSELEQLPDLAGYLKVASSPHWVRIRLARESRGWRSTISA